MSPCLRGWRQGGPRGGCCIILWKKREGRGCEVVESINVIVAVQEPSGRRPLVRCDCAPEAGLPGVVVDKSLGAEEQLRGERGVYVERDAFFLMPSAAPPHTLLQARLFSSDTSDTDLESDAGRPDAREPDARANGKGGDNRPRQAGRQLVDKGHVLEHVDGARQVVADARSQAQRAVPGMERNERARRACWGVRQSERERGGERKVEGKLCWGSLLCCSGCDSGV